MRRIQLVTPTIIGCLHLWCCSSNGTGTGTGTQSQNTGGSTAASGPSSQTTSGGAGARADSGGSAGHSTVIAGSTAAHGGGAGGSAVAAGHSGTGPVRSSDVDAGADDTAGGAAGTSGGSFEACVAALKPTCSYDEKETACASLMTPTIPLTAGGTAGGVDIMAGPYGGYVEWNQGKDFANPVSSSEDTCSFLAATFGEPQSVTDDVLNLRGQDLSLYTVFRPACMKEGEKYPVITWGNGTCGQSGGYAALLATLASHGYVIFAANSRFTDAGNNEMLKALDFAKAANEDPMSIYYQKLDLDKIGAMGHSQGSSATAHAATDPRIKAVILWNAGLSASKPFLAVSGDRDITGYTAAQMKSGAESASQPGAWLFYHKVLETGGNVTGHLTLMEQPERVTEPTIAWWNYMLKGDEEAKKMFVGTDCGLCNKMDDFEFGEHNLP